MENRRRSFRFRTLKSAKILLGAHHLSCTIRNLSETGACLEVETADGIPLNFQFRMPNQSVRACKVIWAAEAMVGVQFQRQDTCEVFTLGLPRSR
jgi:hypothetical protein